MSELAGLVVVTPCRSVLCRNLQFAVDELGIVLYHNVVGHLDPWLPSCSSAFSFPFQSCSSKWVASEYMTNPVSLFSRIVYECCSPTISRTCSFVTCSVQLIFSLFLHPHLECFQPFQRLWSHPTCWRYINKSIIIIIINVITSESQCLDFCRGQ